MEHYFQTVEEVLQIVENSSTNIMYCDRKLVIQYMNSQSLETLKRVASYLPVSVEKVVGSHIDIFHKNPQHQQRILASDRSLPIRSIIQVGPEKLDLHVKAIHSSQGEYIGAVVTWDLVTEALLIKDENARTNSMMENAPINIMCADINGTITYLNPKSMETLRSLEKHLPIKADKIKGGSFDVFHKNPAHQRQLISKESNLPYRALINVAHEKLDLYVTAMRDAKGNYIGPMVVWNVVTKKANLLETLTTELGGSARELSVTAEQMSVNAKATAKNSRTATKDAEELSLGMKTVAASTEEMAASIREISRSSSEAANISKSALLKTQSANTTVLELGKASAEIGNVVKVISSIAQQTNLLALNATIEAARAGEAGKGFSVVANEVKELAKQTAKATEEIAQKIKLIQDSSTSTGTVIGEISKVMESLNAIASVIATAVEEQTAVSNEVARVIQSSDQSTKAIVETFRAVSMAAEENIVGANNTLKSSNQMQILVDNVKELAKEI